MFAISIVEEIAKLNTIILTNEFTSETPWPLWVSAGRGVDGGVMGLTCQSYKFVYVYSAGAHWPSLKIPRLRIGTRVFWGTSGGPLGDDLGNLFGIPRGTLAGRFW